MTSNTNSTFLEEFAERVHSRKSKQLGPVTEAIAAMGREPEPPRRGALKTLAAALLGTIVGAPVYRAKGPDLTAVAEGWLEDARDLGMILLLGPDGNVWRSVPIYDGSERADARDAHWIKLGNRPRLMRAVYTAVERGFVPGAQA